MKVKDCMSPTVRTCLETDTIMDVILMMKKHDVGAVVVTRTDNTKPGSRFPVALICESDIVTAVARDPTGFGSILVKQFCKGGAPTVDFDASREEATTLFAKWNLQHLVVVAGADKELAGLVSVMDIVRECHKDAQAWPYCRKGSD
eukprot:TRINITY_DN87397_c0_g1_i1.p1 TRINITY_DN87397_c0_g1~~TRINITY_DN87397_c0_g1_i1.p1  ORF type:complete len:155 (-),score=10.60 TRINITY_DN87397_c0_g1_i1:119-556(-)